MRCCILSSISEFRHFLWSGYNQHSLLLAICKIIYQCPHCWNHKLIEHLYISMKLSTTCCKPRPLQIPRHSVHMWECSRVHIMNSVPCSHSLALFLSLTSLSFSCRFTYGGHKVYTCWTHDITSLFFAMAQVHDPVLRGTGGRGSHERVILLTLCPCITIWALHNEKSLNFFL
jgi:hypothetical protein